MKTVLRRSIAFSNALIAAGSVVSSTCTSSAPVGTPKVCRKTSGARLLPPMPMRTTSVDPSPTSSLRSASSSGTRSSIRSATWSHPSRSRISVCVLPLDFHKPASFSAIRRTTAVRSSCSSRVLTAPSSAPSCASWAPTDPCWSFRFLFAISSSSLSIESANSLTPSTRTSDVAEFGPIKDPQEGLVGHLRVGDGGLSHQLLQARTFRRVRGRGDLLLEQLVDRGVHSTDEETGHRRYVDRVPVLHAPLQAADEGARDVLVDLDREHQCNVDVHAIGDALLDGGESGIGRRDLDEDVRPPDAIEEIVRHRDRALRIVGNARQDLDADVAVLVLRLLVDRFEHI